MKIVIDLDGVICEERSTFERSLALPISGAGGALRGLRTNGHKIIIYTARGWSEYEMTRDWLNKWNIPYDQLIMGKPVGDVWIDDRAIEFKNWPETWEKIQEG